MPTHTARPVRHRSPLLIATRTLALLHGVGGTVALGYAVVLFVEYATTADDDALAGVYVLFGAGLVGIGSVLVVLATGSVLSDTSRAAHAHGLAAGLFGLALGGPASWLLLPFDRTPVAVASCALVVCAGVGLVRGEASSTADST